MNFQPINPYQIIKALKEENESLKQELAELKEKEGVTDDSVDGNSNGQDTE